MLLTSTSFDTYNALQHKAPIWTLEIDGLSAKFSSGEFPGSAAYLKGIISIECTPFKIDRLHAKTTFQSYVVTLQENSNNFILGLLNTYTMAGREATIKLGYAQMIPGNFISLPAGRIIKVEPDSYGTEYKIYIQNDFALLEGPILRNFGRCVLDADMTDVETTSCTVDDSSSFCDPTAPPWGDEATALFRVDNEYISFATKDATTFSTLGRGVFGSEQVSHEAGAAIFEVMFIYDYGFFTYLMQILTTTAAGTNGDWDLGIDGFGCGLPIGKIDFNQMQNEIFTYGKWGDVSTSGIQSYRITHDASDNVDNALQYIEKEILPQWPAYFYLTEAGQLGLKVWDIIPPPNTGIGSMGISNILEGHILSHPKITEDNKNIINVVTLNRGVTLPSKQYTEIKEYTCDESSTDYGSMKAKTIKIFSETVPTQFYADRMLERIFGRSAIPTTKIDLAVMLLHQVLQSGDVVKLTDSKLPLFRTGTKGWSEESCEVISSSVTYKEGEIPVKLSLESMNASNASDIQDLSYIPESEIDDSDITFNADTAVDNLQAADAYYNPPGATYPVGHAGFIFEITPSGLGADTNAYIRLSLKAQDVANVSNEKEDNYKRIYYDDSSTEPKIVVLYLLNINGAGAAVYPARFRADWFYTKVAAAAPSSLKLVGFIFWNFKSTITENQIK